MSGTVAGNTIFQGSVDGVNFVNLDTLVNTNIAINTEIFVDTGCKYLFYRLRSTGTGTMAYSTKGVYWVRK